MDALSQAIVQLGSSSIRFLWLPLAIWTVFGGLVWVYLKWREEIHPLYQYHLRSGLLVALPAGLFLWLTVGKFMQWFAPEITDSHFIVISSPVILQGNASTLTSVPIWGQADFWVGLTVCLIALIIFIQLFMYAIHFHHLQKYKSSLPMRPLNGLENLSMQNKQRVWGLNKSIFVAVVPETIVPSTFGWKRPVILLPSSLLQRPDQLNVAIRHELVHIARRDYPLQLLVLLIRNLFFFHPVVHLFYHELIEYNEISCDREVLNFSDISRKKYALLLYELVSTTPSGHLNLVSMAHANSNIKKRINAINSDNHTTHSFKISLLITGSLLFCIALIMACSDMQNENLSGSQLLGETLSIANPTVIVNGNVLKIPNSVNFSITGKSILGITYIKTKYGTFLLSGQKFDNARPVGSIDGKNIHFNINEFNVDITSRNQVLQQQKASLWVEQNVTDKMNGDAITLGWASNMDSYKKTEFAQPDNNSNVTGNKTFVAVEKMPELIGGLASLQAKIQYPELARRAGIEGRVYVQFIVDEKGNVTDAKVIKGIGGGCDQEALRVVRSVRFKPGMQRGKPVRVRFALPIVFKLADTN